MKTRRRLAGLVPLALTTLAAFSCNGLLENDPRHIQSGSAEGGVDDEPSRGGGSARGGASAAGGKSASGGDGGASAGTGAAAVDAGPAGMSGGAVSSAGSAGTGTSVGSGGTAVAHGGSGAGGAPPTTCPATADCALSVCDGKSCGANGRKCQSGSCACPGGATRETSCSDGVDNDCDGAVDCADSDCPEHTQCGSAANTRCCGGACVNTESDANNCQACGSKCASGKSCVLLSDGSGRRGHCQCAGTSSLCPGHRSTSPTIICRTDTPNANLCAQESAAACPSGQSFVNVSGGPNFCHY